MTPCGNKALTVGWWKVWKSSLCANTAWLHNTVLLHLSDCIILVYCIALYCRVVYCVELLRGILHCIESYLCHSYHIALHFRMKSSELRCLWVIFKCNNISLCSNTAWLPSEPGIAFYQIALHCIALQISACFERTSLWVETNAALGVSASLTWQRQGRLACKVKAKSRKQVRSLFIRTLHITWTFCRRVGYSKTGAPCSDCVTVIPRKLQQ